MPSIENRALSPIFPITDHGIDAVSLGKSAPGDEILGLLVRLTWLTVSFLVVAAQQWAQTAEVSFQQDVLPVLEKRCIACHQGEKPQKGLRLTTASGLMSGGEAGPAVIPGNAVESLLLAKVSGSKPAMPPIGEPLTAAQIELMRAWIAAGAIDDSDNTQQDDQGTWWSLRPFHAVEPAAVGDDWVRHEIDRFVLAKLHEKGLEPSGDADRRTLIRRLKFDLLGLPPTPEEVDAFVTNRDPAAYEKLVDRFLGDNAYGERWGRHWLDVVRFGESNGYEQNHLRDNAWPYRDWVIRSLNEDKPFNRMIVEQLAGDQVAPGNTAIEAATGFLVAGPHDTVKIQNLEGEAQKRANHLDDMVAATASAFLGLTVHCARCHDHKFDPIQQKDYYRMQSAFAGVWHGERRWADATEIADYEAESAPPRAAIEAAEKGQSILREASAARIEAASENILKNYRPSVDPVGTEESFDAVEARFVRLKIEGATAGRRVVDLEEIEVWTSGENSRNAALTGTASASSRRVEEASPDTYSAVNLVDGKFDKRWISDGGMPQWVMVELAGSETIARVKWSSDRLMGFGGRFGRATPEQYEIEVSLDGRNWRRVADSTGRLPYAEADRERLLLFAVFSPEEQRRWDAFERQKLEAKAELKRLEEPAQAFLGRFEQPAEPSFVMVRGNPMDHGETVSPRSLSVLDGMLRQYDLAATAAEGERRLALARWIASDQNALTARVIVNRIWMHHFGQPLVRTPSDFGVNGGKPTNPGLLEWLAARLVSKHGWRLKPLHREIVLSSAYRQASTFREAAAEVDRDAEFLWRFPPRRLTAEEVRDSVLAVSGSLDRTMGGPGFRLYRYTVDNVATYYPRETFSADTYRRSVYHQHARSVKPELLGQFDCPDSSLPAPKRISTTTPLQALSLLNNSFILDQARLLSERTLSEAGADPEARVQRIWRLAFGRSPDDAELAETLRFADQQGWELLSRAVFNTNEFVYVF
jgi:mono/diheme cytochrome c family protein